MTADTVSETHTGINNAFIVSEKEYVNVQRLTPEKEAFTYTHLSSKRERSRECYFYDDRECERQGKREKRPALQLSL